MQQVNTRTIIGFGLLDGLFWAFCASFVGYISSYFLECGMSNSFLSIVLAMYMAASFIGAFFWGGQCDKRHTNRNVFLPEFMAAVTLSIVIYFVSKVNFYIGAVLYPLFGFVFAPLGSNLDAWMLKSFHKDSGIFGKARAFGSMGYAVAALIIGQLINYFGYQIMLVGIVLFAVPVIAMAFAAKEDSYGSAPEHIEKVNASGLLKIKPYVFMIVILFLSGLACTPVNNLKIVIIKSVGGDVGILGIDSFIGVTIQALFLFVSGKFRKIPPYIRMTVMCLFLMMDMVMIITAANSVMVIIGSMMWNASYGIMLPTIRELTERHVHGALKNTAHAMADAVYGSFAGIIALTYSGVLMDAFGARFVAVVGMAILTVPVTMSIIGMIKERKELASAKETI